MREEYYIDLSIKGFKSALEFSNNTFESLLKSERGFWVYDISEKRIFLSDGSEYAVIQLNEKFNALKDLISKVISENDVEYLERTINECLELKHRGFSSRVKLSDGRWIFICATVLYEEEVPTKILGTFEDVSPHVSCDLRLSRYIELIAYYDDVTGLPNRNFLNETIRDKIKREQSKFWVIFIEVSNFGFINELFGHLVGDEFLRAVASEIKKMLPREWSFCRFGGDEFVVLTTDIKKDSVSQVSESLINRFSKPWRVMGKWIFANVNIGISEYPQDGMNADDLLKNAEIALTIAKRYAKELGKNQYQFYKTSMTEEILKRAEIESEISKGIQENQFFLVYQPKVSFDGRTVVGLEALLRWNSQRGILTPDKFIQIAEESGIIYDINKVVLDLVCKDINYFKKLGINNMPVAINLSGKEFAMYNMVSILNDYFKRHDIEPSDVEIEVTERAILNDIELSKQVFNKLNEKGIKIFLDDFGTGYTSLELLLQLPVYGLKIDKKFVSKVQLFGDEYIIIKNIIYMAKEMNLKTVAEGVENEEQYKILRDLGCDEYQGYFFFEPKRVEELKML